MRKAFSLLALLLLCLPFSFAIQITPEGYGGTVYVRRGRMISLKKKAQIPLKKNIITGIVLIAFAIVITYFTIQLSEMFALNHEGDSEDVSKCEDFHLTMKNYNEWTRNYLVYGDDLYFGFAMEGDYYHLRMIDFLNSNYSIIASVSHGSIYFLISNMSCVMDNCSVEYSGNITRERWF